jgi:hypothetical protein
MQISVSSQTSLLNDSNYFVFALYDASAPTTLLESQQPAKPYGNPLQISFLYNCIKGHIYIIKLWESADSTPTGVVRNSFSQAVNAFNIFVRLPEYYEVDVDAGWTNGATSVTDTSWAGWDYWIIRNPDLMFPDDSSSTTPEYHKVNTGGFNLVQPGDSLQPHERFGVFFVPQTFVDNSGTSIFATGRILTADTTLTNADKGQALLIQSATSKITITAPSLSLMADFDFLYLYSCGGSHINAVIAFQGSDKVNYNGSLRSQLILGQSENLKIYKAFGVWNVENECFGIKNVGQFINSYSNEINAILCDGSLKLRAEYPRLWEWVQQLDASVVVTDTAWTSTFITVNGVTYLTKIGCFSTGDGSTTFRVPLNTNFFIRAIDGTGRTPGSFEVQNVQPHIHDNLEGDTASHASSSSALSGTFKLLVGTSEDGHGVIVNSKTGAVDGIGSNQETKPSNIGAYCLIRI